MTLVKNNSKIANQIFDDFFFNFPTVWGRDAQAQSLSVPPVNIHETNEAYHVELNVPGRNKEDFKILVENNLLTISFEKVNHSEEQTYKTIRREFVFNSFKRSFTLDEKVNAEGIQAKYTNGILQILIPKKEEIKLAAKQISIL